MLKLYDFITYFYFILLFIFVFLLDLVLINEETYIGLFLLVYFLLIFYFLNFYLYVFLKHFYVLLNIFEFKNFLTNLKINLFKNLFYFFFEFLIWFFFFRVLFFKIRLILFQFKRKIRAVFFDLKTFNFYDLYLKNIYLLNQIKYYINVYLYNFYNLSLNSLKNFSLLNFNYNLFNIIFRNNMFNFIFDKNKIKQNFKENILNSENIFYFSNSFDLNNEADIFFNLGFSNLEKLLKINSFCTLSKKVDIRDSFILNKNVHNIVNSISLISKLDLKKNNFYNFNFINEFDGIYYELFSYDTSNFFLLNLLFFINKNLNISNTKFLNQITEKKRLDFIENGVLPSEVVTALSNIFEDDIISNDIEINNVIDNSSNDFSFSNNPNTIFILNPIIYSFNNAITEYSSFYKTMERSIIKKEILFCRFYKKHINFRKKILSRFFTKFPIHFIPGHIKLNFDYYYKDIINSVYDFNNITTNFLHYPVTAYADRNIFRYTLSQLQFFFISIVSEITKYDNNIFFNNTFYNEYFNSLKMRVYRNLNQYFFYNFKLKNFYFYNFLVLIYDYSKKKLKSVNDYLLVKKLFNKKKFSKSKVFYYSKLNMNLPVDFYKSEMLHSIRTFNILFPSLLLILRDLEIKSKDITN